MTRVHEATPLFVLVTRNSIATRVGEWLRASVGLLLIALATGPAYAIVLTAASAVIQPIALDFGETTVYAGTLRILRGEPLYQPVAGPPYTVTPYTPLYHFVAAGLRLWIGEGFGPGRMLSLGAGLIAAAVIGVITARFARTTWAGVLAGLLFLGLAFPGGTPWLGLYRVDLLGIPLSVGAIAVLSTARREPAIVVAGLLAGLALLCKQTYVAPALAGCLWLWPSRRHVAVFLTTVLLVAGAPCVWLELSTHAFAQNILAPLNPIDFGVAQGLIQQLILSQWVPILLAVAYMVVNRPWKDRQQRLLVLYWGASSLQLVGLAKVGANHNYFVEFGAATAILAGIGAATLMRLANPLHTAVASSGLILLLAVSLGNGPLQVVSGGRGSWRTIFDKVQADVTMIRAGSHDPAFDSLVERVRNEPGLVIADPPDVVVLADRPVFFEPLIYTILNDEGLWDSNPAIASICEGAVRLVVLDYRLGDSSTKVGHFGPWPESITAALLRTMRFQTRQAGRNVYVPRSGAGGC